MLVLNFTNSKITTDSQTSSKVSNVNLAQMQNFSFDQELELSTKEKNKFLLQSDVDGLSAKRDDISNRLDNRLDTILSSQVKVSENTYKLAKTYILNTMQNIIEKLKSQGYDTTDLKNHASLFEYKVSSRDNLKNEIIQEANELIRAKDKITQAQKSESIRDKLYLYNPTIDFSGIRTFLALLGDELSTTEQNDILKAFASIEAYERAESDEGIALGQNKRLTWENNLGENLYFKIQDGDDLLIQVQLANDKKVSNTLFSLFENRDLNSLQEKNLNQIKENLSQESSNADLNSRSNNTKIQSKLLQRVLKDLA